MQKRNLGDQLYVSQHLESIGRDAVYESRKQSINLVTLVEKHVRYLSAICAEIDAHFGAENNPKQFDPEEVEVHPFILRLFTQKMRTHVNFLIKISEIILSEKKKLSQSNFRKVSNYFFKKIPSKLNKFVFGDVGVAETNYATIGNDLSNYWNKRFTESRIAGCVISAEELERRHKRTEEVIVVEQASNSRKNWYIWAATVAGPIASSLVSGPADPDIWHVLMTNAIKCGIDTATTAAANTALATADDYFSEKLSVKNSFEALLRGAQYGLCAGLIVEALHDVESAFVWLMHDSSHPALSTPDHGGQNKDNSMQSEEELISGLKSKFMLYAKSNGMKFNAAYHHEAHHDISADQSFTTEFPASSVIATDLSLSKVSDDSIELSEEESDDRKILMVINAMYAVNISDPAEENHQVLAEAELMQQFERRVHELEQDDPSNAAERVLSNLGATVFAYKQSAVIGSRTTLRI